MTVCFIIGFVGFALGMACGAYSMTAWLSTIRLPK
jgi:hypothetical protein